MVKSDLIGTRVGYAQTRAGKQQALLKTREDRQNLEGHLTALVSEQRKIQARLAAVSQQAGSGTSLPVGPVKRGAGQLIWPVNGPITSPFCERRAWEACHPGIDIGAASGTPIHSADGGTVQIASYYGGYGNYTCVQHTASLSTCYGHQSSFAVGTGQNVSQGQVIGYVGCTGLCFGSHLHFEVRVNGSVVDPMGYL
jgi:murein DD-endopeptidase MepM/ murein hydrolase activator NlpD